MKIKNFCTVQLKKNITVSVKIFAIIYGSPAAISSLRIQVLNTSTTTARRKYLTADFSICTQLLLVSASAIAVTAKR